MCVFVRKQRNKEHWISLKAIQLSHNMFVIVTEKTYSFISKYYRSRDDRAGHWFSAMVIGGIWTDKNLL